MQTQDFFDALLGRPRASQGARHGLASLLQAASRQLDLLACRLGNTAAARQQPAEPNCLEFHADAAAPEGALYVNGQLVGHIMGVRRL